MSCQQTTISNCQHWHHFLKVYTFCCLHFAERLRSPTPSNTIPLIPGKFLFPLAQRSTKFPRAKWFCRLCEYHCDNLAKVECFHSSFAHVNYRPCPVLGAHHGAAAPAPDPHQGAGRHAAPAAAPQQEPPGLPQRAAGHRGEGAGALPQRHLLQTGRGQRREYFIFRRTLCSKYFPQFLLIFSPPGPQPAAAAPARLLCAAVRVLMERIRPQNCKHQPGPPGCCQC